MKKYTVTEDQRICALIKMEFKPGELIGDSISYRAGYIRALRDLGMVDGLSAARMLMEIESMEGWEDDR